MPDVLRMELPEYGTFVSKGGDDSYRELRRTHKEAARDKMGELAYDPFRYPDRIKPVSEDEKTLVYSNNEEPFFDITYHVDKENKRIIFTHFVERTTRPL